MASKVIDFSIGGAENNIEKEEEGKIAESLGLKRHSRPFWDGTEIRTRCGGGAVTRQLEWNLISWCRSLKKALRFHEKLRFRILLTKTCDSEVF